MRAFISSMVSHLPIGQNHVQIGLVDFSTRASSVFFLNSHSNAADIKNAVNTMPYYGSHTNTSGAIRVMMAEQFHRFRGDRPNARNYVVILTDGVSTLDVHRTIPDAEAARAQDIDIFAVGVTNAIDERELRAISSPPHMRYKTYWIARTFADLDAIAQVITATICEFHPQTAPAPAIPGKKMMVYPSLLASLICCNKYFFSRSINL